MQKDLHHAGTYLLCRLAGMKSEYAEVVAYSAQYVDDAIYDHTLIFENGGAFQQKQTAYKNETLEDVADNFDVSLAFDILIPFHFLPDVKPYNTDQDLVTDPESKVLERLLEDIKDRGSESIGLHRLGIGLHCYADIFAHQDFIGFCSEYNEVSLEEGEDEGTFIDLFTDKAPIGHAPVVHNPDLPYMEWAYKRDGELIEVNNVQDRFLPGMREMYGFIVDFLAANPQYKGNTKTKSFEDYEDKLWKLLIQEDSQEERHNNWLESIRSNEFGFTDHDEIDENLDYDERAWFNKAVEVVSPEGILESITDFFDKYTMNYDRYRKEDGFAKSNWVKFMLAAEKHLYKVNKEIMVNV